MKKNCFFAIILGISVLLTANSYALSISEFRPQNSIRKLLQPDLQNIRHLDIL